MTYILMDSLICLTLLYLPEIGGKVCLNAPKSYIENMKFHLSRFFEKSIDEKDNLLVNFCYHNWS